jgi:hypothetical protein
MVVLSGCGTPTQRTRMDYQDLSNFQIDCSQKEEQLAFLARQMPSEREQRANIWGSTSIVGWANSAYNGTFDQDQAHYQRMDINTIKILTHQLKQYCPDNVRKQKPQGCVHLDESTPAGSSNGTQCYKNGQKAPAQTRWEATVDN